jgi:hypothetical protein
MHHLYVWYFILWVLLSILEATVMLMDKWFFLNDFQEYKLISQHLYRKIYMYGIAWSEQPTFEDWELIEPRHDNQL